jgi:hypothetical protein
MRVRGVIGLGVVVLAIGCSTPQKCPPNGPNAQRQQQGPMQCRVGTPEEATGMPPDSTPLSGNDDVGPLSAPTTNMGPEAIDLVKEGLRADAAGDLQKCIESDRAALKLGGNSRVFLHISSCEHKKGKLVDALRDAEHALDNGLREKDANVMRVARVRVKELIDAVPHVHFVMPRERDTDILKLTVDGHQVPEDAYNKNFSVDPGAHTVKVVGARNGQLFSEECKFDLAEKTRVPVTIGTPGRR